MIFSIDYENQLITYTELTQYNATHTRFFEFDWDEDRRKDEIIFSNLEINDIVYIPDNFKNVTRGIWPL